MHSLTFMHLELLALIEFLMRFASSCIHLEYFRPILFLYISHFTLDL